MATATGALSGFGLGVILSSITAILLVVSAWVLWNEVGEK